MSIEEEEVIHIPPKEPNYLYVAENIVLSRKDVDNVKSTIGEKFAMLEYFPIMKVAFLWTTDKLTSEELSKLQELYGFYEPY